VQLPQTSLRTAQRLQLGGKTRRLQINPIIKAYEVTLEQPTLNDARADLERVSAALEASQGLGKLSTETAVVRSLSDLARESQWRLTVFVRTGEREREIVGFAGTGRRPLGVAFDLGTTKIAGYLLDLETGEELASAGIVNPQISFGEDVISRIVYAARDAKAAQQLADAVRTGIDESIGALVQKAGVTREQIADACVVGNTAMTHLLLQLPVAQLAIAPFIAATSSAVDVKARDLGLRIAPGAHVHIVPSIGGFVGADHVAMVMGSDLDRLSYVALGVDIGTNTEIGLHRPGQPFVTSVSCASGPAFEGAHMRSGMRAASGAIEAVRITREGIQVKTVEDAPAVGVCGSGIIDAVAEMYRADTIDRRGHIREGAPWVRRGDQGNEIVLVPRQSSGTGEDIVITQHDVSELQLAKSAIATGLEILVESTQIALTDVHEIIVAGAFGSYIDIRNAVYIGLLPNIARAKYSQIGNAAGIGAKMALLSYKERARARKLALRSSYLELTTYPGFNRRFALSTMLPQKGHELDIHDSEPRRAANMVGSKEAK
jgi:uncharacterized 2Fe-2S/4Fe-4S cluster protein (DUF4445 family)